MLFIFLVGFVKIGLMETFEIDEKDRLKEATARFMLLSMIFGAMMAFAQDWVQLHLPSSALRS